MTALPISFPIPTGKFNSIGTQSLRRIIDHSQYLKLGDVFKQKMDIIRIIPNKIAVCQLIPQRTFEH